ncbi:MAG: iron chelate uptake ABC transporter family permease subunit [Defluviitaleaceae bacterium]|nr:iron chelate uptake ABC transporter family permease subunit [Defluviitaleaceae bacterium]
MLNSQKKVYIWVGILFFIALSAILLYLFHNLGPNPGFVLPRRRLRVVSMTVVAIAIAYSSVLFQTVTTMRIFTPSIIGFDALYMFIQSVMVFFVATGGYFITGVPNFLLSVGIMIVFSLVIYSLVFRKGNQNIHFLLLAGMILGTVFSSLTTFIQMLIDPDEFAILQNRIFINFNSVNEDLITVATIVMISAILMSLFYVKYLDVMVLGADAATSLGANHRRLSKIFLLIIAMLVSASTALVGPATFLGLIVTNLTYQLVQSYKHKYIIAIAVLISIIAVVGGQFIVSRVFNLATNLSVIINFIGGLYFMYLLLFKNQKASS